jgi:hypothetical protein
MDFQFQPPKRATNSAEHEILLFLSFLFLDSLGFLDQHESGSKNTFGKILTHDHGPTMTNNEP